MKIWKESLTSILIFSGIFLLFGFFSRFNVDRVHDGVMLASDIAVARGQILFRDTYTQYGALTIFIEAAAMKIFGEYLIVINLTTVFFYALTGVLLWKIWSRFLPKILLAGALILWIALPPFYHVIFHPWSSVYALFFQCLSLFLLIKSIETNKNMYHLFAGASASLAFWCRQPVGIFLEAAWLIYYLIIILNASSNRKKLIIKKLISNLLGFIFVLILFLIYFMITGALHDFWLQSFVLASTFPGLAGRTTIIQFLKSLFVGPLFRTNDWNLLIFLALPLSVVYLSFDLIKRYFMNHELNQKITAIILVCLASWMQYYPVTEIRHCFWGATPMIGIFFYLILKFINLFKNNIKKIIKISVLGLTLIYLTAEIGSGFNRIKLSFNPISKPEILKGMLVSQDELNFFDLSYNFLDKYLKTNPDKTYINGQEDSFYTLYNTKKFHQIRNIFMDSDWINNAIYPDYPSIRDTYIKNKRPVIIYKKIGKTQPGYTYTSFKINNTVDLIIATPLD
jgi:hypothetical protein